MRNTPPASVPCFPRASAPAALRVTMGTLAAAAALGFAGCSTPGPNHAYLAAAHGSPILDVGPAGTANTEVPSFLFDVNPLHGLAYDPFTDHLFLRTTPGNFVRVVDRPARRIKRDFSVENLPPGPGDLAIRSRDRHLFFVHPTEPVLIETNLEGRFVRRVTLEGARTPPAGLAYDQHDNRFFTLNGGDLAYLTTFDLDGKRLGGTSLDRDVLLSSLSFDSVAREFYIPLRAESALGVFGLDGHLLRTIPLPENQPRDNVDVGARSLLRLF